MSNDLYKQKYMKYKLMYLNLKGGTEQRIPNGIKSNVSLQNKSGFPIRCCDGKLFCEKNYICQGCGSGKEKCVNKK